MQKTQFPHDWISSAWPKHELNVPLDLSAMKLVQVGYVLVPEYFSWSLEAPEMTEGTDDVRGIIVSFKATPDGLETMMILGANLDLEEWLPWVIARLPMESWKALATEEMVRWLADDEVRLLVPQLADSSETPAISLTKKPQTAKPRRYKITDRHLKEVVGVYTEAVENGEPPTRAVADRFEVAHSTAAKWVGRARRDGLLEGVAQKWGASKE
ncbi:hypothetical protein [Streptomyces sp. B21-083]|uniref:hypothetical protein n=1 Tax=Streptomyces sp. B21-083 TaxID=3039410 RepID=UPI002FF20D63